MRMKALHLHLLKNVTKQSDAENALIKILPSTTINTIALRVKVETKEIKPSRSYIIV